MNDTYGTSTLLALLADHGYILSVLADAFND